MSRGESPTATRGRRDSLGRKRSRDRKLRLGGGIRMMPPQESRDARAAEPVACSRLEQRFRDNGMRKPRPVSSPSGNPIFGMETRHLRSFSVTVASQPFSMAVAFRPTDRTYSSHFAQPDFTQSDALPSIFLLFSLLTPLSSTSSATRPRKVSINIVRRTGGEKKENKHLSISGFPISSFPLAPIS